MLQNDTRSIQYQSLYFIAISYQTIEYIFADFNFSNFYLYLHLYIFDTLLYLVYERAVLPIDDTP